MNPKISIILPIHNVEGYINEALDSILNQTIDQKNLEVIMVNDYSTDKSGEIIDEYSNKYDNFKAIHLTKNSGSPGKPRNVGIENATGDYLMFFDPDDYYAEDACEVLYNKIIEENVDIVSSRFIYLFETHEKNDTDFFNELDEIKLKKVEENTKMFSLGPNIWTKIYRKEFINNNNIKFLEDAWAEDVAFQVHTLLDANGIIHLNNYFSYYYRVRDRNNKSFTFNQNKKTLLKIMQGYYETDIILKNHEKSEYFPLIFEGHLQYWIKKFVLSDTSYEEKIEILNEVNPIFKKYANQSSKLYAVYTPIFQNIIKNRFEQVILDAKSLKYYFQREENLKRNINHLQKNLNNCKRNNDLLKKKIRKCKKQVSDLQTIIGWLKYKIRNINSRTKNKLSKYLSV
jgi:glycosyltransferase involved in cell wall biosynthesis